MYIILIYLNLNSHRWLVATILDSATVEEVMVNYACKTIRSFSRSVADKGKVSEEVQWQKHPQLPGLSLYRFTHILLSLFLLLFLLSGKDIVSLPQS